MWSPKLYNKFKAEQFAPFADLLNLVVKKPNLRAIDLGCGNGELTSKLAESLPNSDVLGIDTSPEMLQEARTFQKKRLNFKLMSIEDVVEQKNKWNLVFSHQAMHWVASHKVFFPKLINTISEGGQLALLISMPDATYFKRDLDELAKQHPFKAAMKGWTWQCSVLKSEEYATLLFENGGTNIIVYEKVFPTLMKDADASFDMSASTAMIPYLKHLPQDHHQNFMDEYRRMLWKKYPEQPMFFPYKRIYVAATF